MPARPARLRVVLDVPAPCLENWNDMDGGEQVRLCARCETPIFNLSALTEKQIAELVARDKVCVRLEVDANGELVSKDSTMRGHRRAARITVAAALSALSACSPGQAVGTVALTHDSVGSPAGSSGLPSASSEAVRNVATSSAAPPAPVLSEPPTSGSTPPPSASAGSTQTPITRDPSKVKVGMIRLAQPKRD